MLYMLLYYIILHQCKTQDPTQHAVQNMQSSLHDTTQNPHVYLRYGSWFGLYVFSRSLWPRQWSRKSKRKSKISKKMPIKKWKPLLKRTSETSGPSCVRSFFFYFASLSLEPCDMIDSCNMYSPEPHLGWLRSALQAWRHCWGPQDRWMLGRQRFIQTVQISLAALSGHDHSQAHSGGKEGATTCGDVTQRQKSHELSTRANCRGWFVSFAQQTILGGSFSCSDFRREL